MHCFYKTSKPIILMLMHISTATNIRATLDLFSLIHGQLVMVVVIVTKKDKWKFKVRDHLKVRAEKILLNDYNVNHEMFP